MYNIIIGQFHCWLFITVFANMRCRLTTGIFVQFSKFYLCAFGHFTTNHKVTLNKSTVFNYRNNKIYSLLVVVRVCVCVCVCVSVCVCVREKEGVTGWICSGRRGVLMPGSHSYHPKPNKETKLQGQKPRQ